MQYSCQICGKTYLEKGGRIQFASDTLHAEQYFPVNAFEILSQSEEKNFWFRARNKITGNVITLNLYSQSRILGLGQSYFISLFSSFIPLIRKLSLKAKNMNDKDMKKKIQREAISEIQPKVFTPALFFLIFSLEVPLQNSVTLPFGSSPICGAIKGDMIS